MVIVADGRLPGYARYADRAAAGEALAQEILRDYPELVVGQGSEPGSGSPVVLALPRGGVPVASPVAHALGVRLSVQHWSDPTVDSDLLVCTAAAGAADERADEWVSASSAVFDVVYDPWPTVLAQAAADQDRIVLSGLDLLVHQAVLQVELMTGASVPAGVLYHAGRTALAGF